MTRNLDAVQEWRNLVDGLRSFMEPIPSKRVILGLSRGFDSTMVAAIAAEALGGHNVLGVALPSIYSADPFLTESKELAEHLGIRFMSVPISSAYNSAMTELELASPGLTEEWSSIHENMQSRLRAVMLMALSNGGYGMVLNTGNLSERLLGYYTLYGDSIGSVSVIGNYLKTELWDIARGYNEARGTEVVPQYIIDAPPTAELAPGQTDEAELGNYARVDAILAQYLNIITDDRHRHWRDDPEIVLNYISYHLKDDTITREEIAGVMQRVVSNAFKLYEKPVLPTSFGRAI